MAQKKTERVNLRFTPDEAAAVRAAAGDCPVTTWAAREVLRVARAKIEPKAATPSPTIVEQVGNLTSKPAWWYLDTDGWHWWVSHDEGKTWAKRREEGER